jgi:hypothetical protein
MSEIVEFEISADELDHLLFLNFNNDLPDKGLRPVLQGALARGIVLLSAFRQPPSIMRSTASAFDAFFFRSGAFFNQLQPERLNIELRPEASFPFILDQRKGGKLQL